ncbi:signal peptide protein [Actinoplanes sp. SE50]|uniref:putative bifunctional diguanylate cyclase/phosphodiesterase n=1 Tax=unclassified Actinoplanes TaxID=2626549 RepID=UPI00023EC271|nr:MULTISPECIES: bifunctional diguanylate cyclase/phosphodiesterase [unclassified Actinoplanes]AEV83579.1 putative signaling protein [Actinoplanes sp. SE50/110]ATO82277.1 signal peptide protein [Actinoplanes sp. SE50]SLL99684.1 hypothetical protein ACSP50_2915 [Actinoplanes sp. SE50/110]
MRRSVVWRWWLVAGVSVTGGCALLPSSGLAANLGYNAIGLLAALAVLAGVRLHRPERARAWYWLSAGQAATVTGDLLWEYFQYIAHQDPFPSVADVFYLSAYPMLAAGLWLLFRGRSRAGGVVNALIAGLGLGLVYWILVVHPIAADNAGSGLAGVIATAYPAGDLLLLVMVAGLVTSRAGGTAAVRLLAAAASLLLVTDGADAVATMHGYPEGALFSSGWAIAYLFWGAAALHPSMAAAPQPAAARPPRAGSVQYVLPTVCALLPPAMLFLPWVGGNRLDRVVLGGGSAALTVLAAAQVAMLMRRVRGQAAELRQQALHDDLTGLPNRRRFEQALHHAARTGTLRVIFLGLTGFKSVNDEFGRPVGDRVLTVVAGRIAAASPAGALLSRLGGDEFALLAPADVPVEEIARRIVAALAAPVPAGGHELLAGANLGLAEAGEPVEALRRAEAAMHAAKSTGEPFRHWSPALDERAGEAARLGAELRAALQGDQFRVFYQPIVRVPEGRVTALEALVRWEHPVQGMVRPDRFIPVAEQTGLIVELGAWVLRTACERLVRWRAELGPDAPDRISVNVSARQLARPEFPDTVAGILALTGLPAGCLTVEVTETAVFGGGQAVTALHRLREIGVRIALDDFGTGHSSLGLLQTVPVDVIKVDKSFVDRVTEPGRHSVIARALIQVSDGLGLTAVAEGVETAEQAEALRELGYHLLQGYFYGRPEAEPDLLSRPVTAVPLSATPAP